MYKIRDWLFIGNTAETTHDWFLKLNGVGAMLQLARYVPQADVEILYLPVEDAAPLPAQKIEKGVEFIKQQKAAGKTTLVVCGAGVSRSVTFAIAALLAEEKRDIFDAYREILLEHRTADPHPELIVSLSAYCGKTITRDEATEALFAVYKDLKH